MEIVYKLTALVILMLIRTDAYAEGQNEAAKLNVTVSLWNGQVTLHWDTPDWITPNSYYEVQLTEYTRKNPNWTSVLHCKKTVLTTCDLSNIVTETKNDYRVRVRMVTGQNVSTWAHKCFNLRESKLLPPAFSIATTSSSVKVRIHINPTLNKIFKYGLEYHIFLRDKENAKVLRNITWEQDEQDPEVVLGLLQWRREYCVCMTVEDLAGDAVSVLSEEQCAILPHPEWYPLVVMAFLVICILAVLFLMALFLRCFLRRPEKLPITLKSPEGGWHPLILGKVPVEIVTDKGFLLTTAKRADRCEWSEKGTELDKEQERRHSLDSGVSLDQRPTDAELRAESERRRKEDSGCGSLGGTGGSTGRGDLGRISIADGTKLNHSWLRHEEQGSMGMAPQYGDASGLEGADSTLMPGLTAALGSEHCTFTGIHVGLQTHSDTENSVMAPAGYRPSQMACVCANQGLCLWCRVRTGQQQGEGGAAHNLDKEDSLSNYNTTNCPEKLHASSGMLFQGENSKTDSCQSAGLLGSGGSSLFPDSLSADCSDITPLLISVPQFALLDDVLDCKLNDLPLSLHDMELTFG